MKKEKHIIERESIKNGKYFQVRVQLRDKNGKKTTENGGNYYIKNYKNTREAMAVAIEKRDEILQRLKDKEISEIQATVASLYEEKFELFATSIKTKERHDAIYRKLIGDKLGAKKIVDVTAEDVQKSLVNYAKDHTQDRVNYAMSIWREIYRCAAVKGIRIYNVTESVIVPKSKVAPTRRNKEITRENYEKFLEELIQYNYGDPNGRYRNMMIFYALQIMLYTGMRPAEAFGLYREDIDIENRIIYVRHQVGSTTNETRKIIPTKTEASENTVPIAEGLIPILEEMLEWSDKKPLLADYDGLPIEIDTISSRINNVSKKCKKKYGFSFNMYMLRHLMATELIQNGTDVRTVQAIMRHTNADMSVYYATVNEKKKIEAIEKRASA